MKEKCLHINYIFNILITFFLLLQTIKISYCQDVEFSQFFNNPLYTNPANAGEPDYSRLCINYRSRWPFNKDLKKSYVSYNASYDQPLIFAGGGIGLLVTHDILAEGILSNTTGGIMYSHHIEVSRDFILLASLQFTVSQSSLDASNIILPDMVFINNNVPNENISSESFLAMDYSLGLLASYNYFEAGFTTHHLTSNSSQNSIIPYPGKRKFSILTQYTILLENIRTGKIPKALIPSIIYQSQGSFQQLQYGIRYQINPLSSGIFIKQNLLNNVYGIILYLGITYKSYTFGYSYDYNLPNKGVYVPFSGGHELTLKINLQKFEKSKGIKAIKCPKI